MNLLTLFHRATDAVYSPPCDVASVPVVDMDGTPAGFVGASWGEHPDPPDCLNWAIIPPEEIDATLAIWGLQYAPAPSPPEEV